MEIRNSIFHKDVQFGLTRLAGPNLTNFTDTVQEEGFFGKAEGNWGWGAVVHDGSMSNHCKVVKVAIAVNLNWKVLVEDVKSDETTSQL